MLVRITRCRRCAPAWLAVLVFCASAETGVADDQSLRREPLPPLVHPGLLHGGDDLERIRSRVAAREQPWFAGFEALAADRHSNPDGRLVGPRAVVIRDPSGRGRGSDAAMAEDARAAYQNAIMWIVTQDRRHAAKAIEILNAWGATLQEMGGRDVQLAAGLNGFLLVNAAEVMRHTDSGWSDEDVATFERMLLAAVYPAVADFATFANGNWDAACIKTTLAIGVFCDDREIFNRGVDYFLHGAGNGRITHYVINEAGQTQESGRDQQHVQLGLGCLAEACEIAWRQGIDLYGASDNRLLAGYEYTARYLSGQDVPFVRHVDTTGKYRHEAISSKGRSGARPVFEIVYGHYVGRAGLQTPSVAALLERVRPERGAHRSDHPGFGTLLFFQGPASP